MLNYIVSTILIVWLISGYSLWIATIYEEYRDHTFSGDKWWLRPLFAFYMFWVCMFLGPWGWWRELSK